MIRFHGFCRPLIVIFFLAALLPGAEARGSSLPSEEELEYRAGQMLMVGFRGLEVEDAPFILRDIRQRNLGGVILFDYDLASKARGRNIESPSQLEKLIADLKGSAPTPLLVAIDQEGGKVARLKARDGFPATPSHGELGRLGAPESTGREASKIAGILSGVGIGMNLAPVVDLCANPDNPVIARYDRCFSDDPRAVTEHASRYIKAHRGEGVLTALKHFPGHGSSSTDSHAGFTDVTTSWTEAELEPYARLIDAGDVDAVMTAHVFNAKLDPHYPASLSRATLTGVLREQLKFEGVILTDDLQMGAITDLYDLKTAVRLAIEAGSDMLILGNNLDYDERIVPRVTTIIRQLVEEGALSLERIESALRRIERLKRTLTDRSVLLGRHESQNEPDGGSEQNP